MKFSKSAALGAAAVTAASLGAVAVIGGTAAGASERAVVPTVTVHVGGGKIGIVGGDGSATLHAGRIKFKVVTGKGSHILQILRLHSGYTVPEAGQDLGKAFSGDLDALRRIDNRITWRGGATAAPNKPGWFAVTLHAGSFYFIDQNSNARKHFTVVGSVPNRPAIPHQGQITAFTYGFGNSANLPANGTIYFHNQADQPHFLEVQHVKAGTTRKQITAALRAPGQPDFILKGSTGSGVISPGTGQMLSYDLPAGRYLIACFWPALENGMPHAFMGMFKLVTLK